MINQCLLLKNEEIQYTRDPEDNKKIIHGYKILKVIGEGAYGKIKLAEKDKQLFAIKKFNKFILKKKNKIYKNPDGSTKYVSLLEEVYRELQIHQSLNHKNIIQLYAIFDDENREKLYAVMEYAQQGQILKWDSKKLIFHNNLKIDDLMLKNYTQQILQGLEYLHSQFIVHRDIKPHNILIAQNDIVKICDFGCAQQLKTAQDRVKGTEGTFQFVSPESLRENKKSDIPGYSGYLSDIWSLGVVLFCIVDKRLPFYSENMLELFNQIEQKEITMEYDGPIRQLILLMLDRDTQNRPSATQLLKNPYFY